MSYFSSPVFSSIQEPPFPYSSFSRENAVYEVSLRVSSAWLHDLQNAHRLTQALLQGEILGAYELFDFFIWPGGLLIRLSLKKTPSLAESLRWIKEKSAPPERVENFWEDEPQWIRLVTPERLSQSSQTFLETTEAIRQNAMGFSANLFFFYRNPRLGR